MKDNKENALVRSLATFTRANDQEPIWEALCVINNTMMSLEERRTNYRKEKLMKKIERETIITFNEAEQNANLYTCSTRLIHQIEKKIISVPEQFKLIKVYKDLNGREYAREYELTSKLCVSIRKKHTCSQDRVSVLRNHLLNKTEGIKGDHV